MKKIYIVLLNIAAFFSPLYPMLDLSQSITSESSDIDLTESTVEPKSVFPTEQKKKISKPLTLESHKKQSINFLQQKSTQEKIKSLSTKIENINDFKQKQYKPIIDTISSTLKNPKKLTNNKLTSITYTLDIINGKSIKIILQNLNKQPISLYNKLSILTDLHNLPQPSVYQELESSLYTTPKSSRDLKVISGERYVLGSWLEAKAEIITELNKLELQYKDQLIDTLKKEEMTLKVLHAHKKILEKSIDQLKNVKTPEGIAKKNKSQEILNTISHQINLFTAIDTQLLIDYSSFSTKQLLDYIESLIDLRTQLNNFDTQRYKKLNTTIEEALSYLPIKREYQAKQEELVKQKADEREQLYKERLARLAQENLEQEKQGQELNKLIKP